VGLHGRHAYRFSRDDRSVRRGYNHLVKNVLYFGGASSRHARSTLSAPAYEMPNDLWFEVTGILQFFVGLYAGYCLVRLWRENRIEECVTRNRNVSQRTAAGKETKT
jgi:hypothetical protein